MSTNGRSVGKRGERAGGPVVGHGGDGEQSVDDGVAGDEDVLRIGDLRGAGCRRRACVGRTKARRACRRGSGWLPRERVFEVAGAQAGLDVAEAHVPVERGQRRGEDRGGVALGENPVRLDLRDQIVEELSSLAVRPPSVWSGCMTFKSRSGRRSKRAKTWSSIWRCWPVEQTTQRTASGRFRSARMTGAILIASGRVPRILRTVINLFSHLPDVGTAARGLARRRRHRWIALAPTGAEEKRNAAGYRARFEPELARGRRPRDRGRRRSSS